MKPSGKYVITAICVAIVAAVAWNQFKSAGTVAEEDTAAVDDTAPEGTPSSLELPEGKLSKMHVVLSEAAQFTVSPETYVPGRLQYDDRRHVEIRTAAAGIVRKILVRPGDQVQVGDVLAEVNSPEAGQARADVLQHQSEVRIAADNKKWQQSTCDGLRKLTESIRNRTPVNEIRNAFKDVVLGKSRDQLLSAYSDLLLAESLVAAAQQNAKNGILPARTLEERTNQRDSAEAALLSGLEEQSFEARQRCQQATAQLEDAERRFRISQQTVRTLLGKFDDEVDPQLPADLSETEEQMAQLSLVELRAPFAGTIERRMVSTSERVGPGDSLITLADTSTLWVAADLREREWTALSLTSGDKVKVATSVPGLESLEATVYFVGREVDSSTNAVPLVAVIENPVGKLRPGMFVRVAVPVSEPKDALTVPESAILEHDSQSFVFTPDGDSSFRRVDIQTGTRADGMVEVVTGLHSGDKVVSSGAFFLKSELLLQGEAE